MESVTLISRCAIRGETVHLWTKFGSFGLTLNEEQIPQIVKNNKNQGGRETSWKDFFCAQGRCATRTELPTVRIWVLSPYRLGFLVVLAHDRLNTYQTLQRKSSQTLPALKRPTSLRACVRFVLSGFVCVSLQLISELLEGRCIPDDSWLLMRG
jgi:hypothetical protein